jgi:sugar/nucleoside kinase (ribokinase family)
VRGQCTGAALAGLDSMNYWIHSARDALLDTMQQVDVIVLNDAEIRMLTNEPNLTRGARQIRELGPRIVVVKQGSYGACLFTDDGFFFVPGYPLETVVDPTGAGDAFAGGFFGYLDCHSDAGITDEVLRCAAVYGSVVASFAIEAFGSERLQRLTLDEIEGRFSDFKRMTHFEALPVPARVRT